MGPTKGKQGTKGAKQIKEENKQTYEFYIKMVCAANIAFIILHMILYYFYGSFRYMQILMLLFSIMIYAGCMMSMSYMSNGGLDLNMEAGIGEHLKDILILTAICQTLGSITLYFWLLWLLIPSVAFYKFWVNILGPWFFSSPPEVEISDKKRKKMERKQQRVVYR